jgi:hypothetical protein
MRPHPLREGAREGIGRKISTRDFLLAVDAVGVAGQPMHAGFAAQCDCAPRAGIRRCARRGRRRARDRRFAA